MKQSILHDAIELPRTPTAGELAKSPPARARTGRVIVCTPSEQGVVAVLLRVRRAALQVQRQTLTDVRQAAAFRRQTGRQCPWIVLLPRSLYLLRALELPKVPDAELAAMLRLETETSLPPDFSEVEISYREIRGEREGYRRFEVYAARREDVNAYLQPLQSLNVTPTAVLPSAAVWYMALRDRETTGLAVAASNLGWAELASLEPDHSISIRRIEPSRGAERQPVPEAQNAEASDNGNEAAAVQLGLDRGLWETIRFTYARRSVQEPLRVDWIGVGCPDVPSAGPVLFQDSTADFMGSSPAQLNGMSDTPLLCLAARTLVTCGEVAQWRTANMVPQSLVEQRQRATSLRASLAASLTFLVALALLYSAMQISLYRLEHHLADLTNQIQTVQTEGEAVGARLEQLRSVRATRLTRQDFFDVVKGLYDATPDGVTYSQVDLSDDGVLRIRGQAQSLALPFVLPERLENQPQFHNVLLRDAGQTKRGDGSITEFRIECQITRSVKGAKPTPKGSTRGARP